MRLPGSGASCASPFERPSLPGRRTSLPAPPASPGAGFAIVRRTVPPADADRTPAGTVQPMHELAAWILFPLIALAICTGIGLLAERLARAPVPPAVLPALGFAAAIAVLGPLFATGVGGGIGCALLIGLAVARVVTGIG